MTEGGLIPVFDGHNDSLLRLHQAAARGEPADFLARGTEGHLDLPRAREGGFAGGFFAAFVPSRGKRQLVRTDAGYEMPLPAPPSLGHAQRTVLALAATLFRLERQSAGALEVVRTVPQIRAALARGALAAIFHLEGAEAIGPDLDALVVLYEAGLRSLGLVWSRPNRFGCGVPFRFPGSPDTGPGLTDAGRALVRACNQQGILIDLSHINQRGFFDVAETSSAPLVATHSAVHAICPAARNLTDAQLQAIRASGGVVGLNFAVSQTRPDGRNEADTPLEVPIRHLEYLLEQLGEDGVALGSDFDGTVVPQVIGDAAGLPRLFEALRQRGHGEPLLRKIGFENWLSVLERTWRA
jgi:membrane dipeptidase